MAELHIPRPYLNAYKQRLAKGDAEVLKLDNIRKQGQMEPEQFEQYAISVLSAQDQNGQKQIAKPQKQEGEEKKSNLFPALGAGIDDDFDFDKEMDDIFEDIDDIFNKLFSSSTQQKNILEQSVKKEQEEIKKEIEIENKNDIFPQLKKIKGTHTIFDDVKNTNPLYKIAGGNCSKCSIALWLRRLGYDVVARTQDDPIYTGDGGYLLNCFGIDREHMYRKYRPNYASLKGKHDPAKVENLYAIEEPNNLDKIKHIETIVSSSNNGDCFILRMGNKGCDFGHYMFIQNINGIPCWCDGQDDSVSYNTEQKKGRSGTNPKTYFEKMAQNSKQGTKYVKQIKTYLIKCDINKFDKSKINNFVKNATSQEDTANFEFVVEE